MMYQIIFYAPKTHVEQIKNAMFNKGAGKMGQYSCCAWQTLGEGQFMPLADSNPYIGQTGQLERVPEYKVEMVCEEKYLKEVIAALKQSHPYEQPAFIIMKMEVME